MTFTITTENIYLSIILLLIILQVYQWSKIKSLKVQLELQIHKIVIGVASALIVLEKKIDEKQDKQ
jgi:hypothetical protein